MYRTGGEFLAVGLMTFSLLFSGCETSNKPIQNPSSPTTTPGPKLGPELPSLPPPLEVMYPELRRARLSLTSTESVATSRAVVSIYNFSNYRIRKEVATEVYRYLEGVGESNVGYDSYILKKEPRHLAILPETSIRRRVVVFIPEKGPKPGFVKAQGLSENIPGLTGKFFPGEYADISLTYLEPFKNSPTEDPKANLTEAFAIEACQQTLIAGVFDNNKKLVLDREELLNGQEAMCNYLGMAISDALLKKGYKEYQKDSQQPLIKPYGDRKRFTALKPINESSYLSIKSLGTIVE